MFKFDENGKNFLNLNLTQTIQLLATLCLLAILIAAAIIIFKTKRQNFKKYCIVSLCVFLLFCLGIIVFNVASDFASDSQDYQQYQLFLTITLFVAIIIVTMVVLSAKDKSKSNAKALAYAAVCLSISFALSYVRIYRMPQGGSVTLASITLLGLYSYMFGVKKGFLACFAYGILQSLQDPWVVHPIQYILDYPLAYTMVGFVGIFRNFGKSQHYARQLVCGFAVAVVLRYICHFFSGAIFFGEYGEDFGILNIWAWGALYNLPVLIDGTIACLVALFALSSLQVRNLILTEKLPLHNIETANLGNSN